MPFRIGPPPPESPPAHQPPPNYSNRWVQLRLLLLVGVCTFVIIAMFEARKPENYKWMGFEDRSGAITSEERTDEQFDTRLRMANPSSNGSPVIGGEVEPEPIELPDLPASNPLDRTVRDGWSKIIGDLSMDEKDLIFLVLKSIRQNQELSDERRTAWKALLEKFNDAWDGYRQAALDAVIAGDDLSNEQKTAWLELLQETAVYWEKKLEPALAVPLAGRTPTAEQTAQLERFQVLMDEIALAAVRDNTILNRPVEKSAWFRFFEALQQATPAALAAASEGRVGFAQLYKQPKTYRGKIVTVRGDVRLAYHVQAPENDYNIKGYYVFVLRPAGGGNSPIVIYALETPKGFPEIKDKDLDRETTELDEPCEFTGYFFKRYAYRAKEGTRTAPLMLARGPAWDQPASPASKDDDLPSIWFFVGILLVTALLGAAIAFAVYRFSSSESPVPVVAHPKRIESLKKLETRPSVEQVLKNMSDEEG